MELYRDWTLIMEVKIKCSLWKQGKCDSCIIIDVVKNPSPIISGFFWKMIMFKPRLRLDTDFEVRHIIN